MSKICECSMAIRVLGDGCRHCQPKGYIDMLEDQAKDNQARIEHLERVLVQAGEALKAADMPLSLYNAYGWPDRDGVRCKVKKNIAAINEALKEQG